ncbi:sugar ABC transporter substrate-binding protein [Actinoplanes sp. NPDC000266]
MRHKSWLATMAAVLAVTAAGCSSGSAENSAAQGATSDAAKQALQAAYTGATGVPPTASTTPKKGVKAWVVSCGQQLPSCTTPTNGIVEAAKAIGWEVNVCDGKLSPDGWGSCVDQAATAKADVVFPVGIDCASVKAPFEAAAKAGVKIIGAGGSDCTATGGTAVFATERLQLDGVAIDEYWKKAGAAVANYLIGSTDGKANVLELKFTDPVWGPWLSQGFEAQIATCSTCKIVGTLDIANADLGSSAGTDKFSAALQKFTDANAVYVPVGGWMSTGFAAAVKASGRASSLVVASGFGDASALDLVRNNDGLNAVLGYATEWGSYGSVDEAIRVLNGEKPVVEGDGFQVVDAKTNMPASGDYIGGDVDFKTKYRALWGIG